MEQKNYFFVIDDLFIELMWVKYLIIDMLVE